MAAFLLACMAYLVVALPASALGLLWPSMQAAFHEPVGALGVLLVLGVTASVISSTAVGYLLSRMRVGPLLALGTALTGLALAEEALSPSLWVIAVGFVVFGLGFGATNSALNVHAASHFGARQITWMHASYGLGATLGPLLVTVVLGSGLSWRWVYGISAPALALFAVVFAITRGRWEAGREPAAPATPPATTPPASTPPAEPAPPSGRRRSPTIGVASALTFVAVEMGIESGAGIWGYVFLTGGRGLGHDVAGVAISAYWAMIFVGRAIFGPVAERVGAGRVLRGSIAGVVCGAALMTMPGPGFVAVAGITIVGLATAPIFPLLTLTTAQRVGGADAGATTRTVSLQVAASAVGNAVLPGGLGLIIGSFHATSLAPSLLVLSVAMCGVYALLPRLAGPTVATAAAGP